MSFLLAPTLNNYCSFSSSIFSHEIPRPRPTLLFSYNGFVFSYSVMSDSLRPHGLQHTRLPCTSPSPGACSKSCPLSWRCHATTQSSVIPFSSCLYFSPSIRVFSNEWALHIMAKLWRFNFSISPSSEYSGLISFRIDWFDLLPVQVSLLSLEHKPPDSIPS